MKILVGICGEKYGQIGIRLAGKIARATDGEVTMLHVIPEIFTTHHKLKFGAVAKSQDEVAEILEHSSYLLEREGVKSAKAIQKRGEPAREILRESEKGYQIIVTGTKGLRGVEKFLFGSVSLEVAEYARIPVLAARKDAELKDILVCTDGSDHALEAEYCCGYLAKRLGARVTVLSVGIDNEEVKKHNKRAVEKGKKMLKKEFGIDAECKIRTGKRISKEILKEAEHHDMVILGSRGLSRIKRLLMGHVSLKVLERAKTNVLIVRHYIEYEKKLK